MTYTLSDLPKVIGSRPSWTAIVKSNPTIFKIVHNNNYKTIIYSTEYTVEMLKKLYKNTQKENLKAGYLRRTEAKRQSIS